MRFSKSSTITVFAFIFLGVYSIPLSSNEAAGLNETLSQEAIAEKYTEGSGNKVSAAVLDDSVENKFSSLYDGTEAGMLEANIEVPNIEYASQHDDPDEPQSTEEAQESHEIESFEALASKGVNYIPYDDHDFDVDQKEMETAEGSEFEYRDKEIFLDSGCDISSGSTSRASFFGLALAVFVSLAST